MIAFLMKRQASIKPANKFAKLYSHKFYNLTLKMLQGSKEGVIPHVEKKNKLF